MNPLLKIDPVLGHLIELLREELSAADRALFQELAETDLDGLTAALNEALSNAAPSGSTAEVVDRVRLALAKASGTTSE